MAATRLRSIGRRDWRMPSKTRMTWCWRAMTSWVGKCRNQAETDRADTSGSVSSLVGGVRNPNMVGGMPIRWPGRPDCPAQRNGDGSRSSCAARRTAVAAVAARSYIAHFAPTGKKLPARLQFGASARVACKASRRPSRRCAPLPHCVTMSFQVSPCRLDASVGSPTVCGHAVRRVVALLRCAVAGSAIAQTPPSPPEKSPPAFVHYNQQIRCQSD